VESPVSAFTAELCGTVRHALRVVNKSGL